MDTLEQSISNSDLTLVKLSPALNENDLGQEERSDGASSSFNSGPKPPKSKPNHFIRFIRDYIGYLKAMFISMLISGLKSSGPIPKHVAIIMDGNRRYAKKKGFSHVSEGHFEGAKTLEKVKIIEFAEFLLNFKI